MKNKITFIFEKNTPFILIYKLFFKYALTRKR